jgi:DNA-binding NtrC family response regulator
MISGGNERRPAAPPGVAKATGAGRESVLPPVPAAHDRGYAGSLIGAGISVAPQRQAALHPIEGLPLLHLLVVDDDDAVRNACAEIARKMGFVVVTAHDYVSAEAVVKHQKLDLVLLDLKLPGAPASGGLELLTQIKSPHPDTLVIVMTAFATVSSAVEAMRVGASDYLTKPFALEELVTILERTGERRQFDIESRRLRETMRQQKGAGPLVGRSPEMEKLYRILSKVANSSHPVLVLGESGTGKELVVRAIHSNGPTAGKPFIPVDCGSLAPSLLESELFGYVKGAFPAAVRAKDGLLVTADGGTVLLDEIGELPLDLQAKLLRALQERAVRPMGGTHSIPLGARVVASSNRDLAAMVEQGRFRKDLYFRLSVVSLRIPPLRNRKDDIPLLAQFFLDRNQRETGLARHFSDDALRTMVNYDWPGNVRELENAVDRACALSSGPTLHMGDLPTQLHDFRLHAHGGVAESAGCGPAQPGSPAGTGNGHIVSLEEMERHAILGTIRQLRGDKLMAAKLLGIGKTTLYRKLKEYGIAEEE